MSSNDLILISGYSASGKSASLRNIKNQDKWIYLNTESGKRLPFANRFKSLVVTDPWQVHQAMEEAKDMEDVEGIVVDSLTFLMDMYESQYVNGASNGMKAWGEYGNFFRTLMQEKVPLCGKPVIFTAHLKDELDERTMDIHRFVPIKGALKNNGVEAYFSTVVTSKKMALRDLDGFESDLLVITDEDKELGFKYVFQTRITKKTVNERIRSPMGMFSKEQTYMDNDVELLIKHLKRYYEQ